MWGRENVGSFKQPHWPAHLASPTRFTLESIFPAAASLGYQSVKVLGEEPSGLSFSVCLASLLTSDLQFSLHLE